MDRREFLALLAKAGVVASLSGCSSLAGSRPEDLYRLPKFGSARLLHITDTHAQLEPVYFREPSVNLGIGPAKGQLPHRVGKNLLAVLPAMSPRLEHAYTCLDFTEAAERFGRVGGFSHLATLVAQLRDEAGGALLLDGGDTWQGSGTALWTRGQDMVGACNRLGVDVMTGHWEFTYLADEVLANVAGFSGEFVAQNILATEEALFEGVDVYDEDTGHVFKPYTMKTLNGRRIAVIGQAFPYTPIANPGRFIPDWTFGIREAELSELVETIRRSERPDAVILLSHNGMDVDLKLASRVTGIDAILGGHTHDGVPVPVEVRNASGTTLVTNAGSNGKFVGVLDLEFGANGVSGYQYRLLPVFANLLEPDGDMQAYIDAVRKPYLEQLGEELAVTDSLLYRRGNFNGTFDQVICDALRERMDAEISLSPGFRWGTSVLPGDVVTMERVLDQTCMTYPETYVRDMKGAELKTILESVADNLFTPDPYYQQGGDMVRTGGLDYVCYPWHDFGSRVTELRLKDGTPIMPDKVYRVAGWATVGSASDGPPVWDVVADYLRDHERVSVDSLDTPLIKGLNNNPGMVA
ncbi:MAG: thiosulfohydrolase SoxB [Proteobacteria bacterium]|nr:thiosulfohydrolase SoxB [Pseudomonadota bacterium]